MKDIVPIIRYDDVKSGAAAEQVIEALSTVGAFAMVDCPTDPVAATATLTGMAKMAAIHEKTPDRMKQYHRPDLWHQRGFSPPGTEEAVLAAGQRDHKVNWFAGVVRDPRWSEYATHYPTLFAENVWPDEGALGVPGFRSGYERTGRLAHDVGFHSLVACELGLGLPEKTLTRLLTGGPHISRALTYLALHEKDVGTDVLWGEEHTDFNALTVIPAWMFLDAETMEATEYSDDQCGLWIKRVADNRLMKVKVPQGAMVVQLGQALEILTGGKLMATPHIVRPPLAAGIVRSSYAHFMHFDSLTMLLPLDQFRDEPKAPNYSMPKLAGTFEIATLVDIGLAPASALSSLSYNYDALRATREPTS